MPKLIQFYKREIVKLDPNSGLFAMNCNYVILQLYHNFLWIYSLDLEYNWIYLQRKILANMDIIPLQVGRGLGKEVVGGIVILASCEYHFIRVYENLVQHPSNYIWTAVGQF